MMLLEQSHAQVEIPQGVGYHPRFIMALAVIAAMIVILFIYFIYQYSPRSVHREEQSIVVHDDPRSSRILKKLQEQKISFEPLAFEQSMIDIHDHDTLQEGIDPLPKTIQDSDSEKPVFVAPGLTQLAFTQAGQAEISVFKKTNTVRENDSIPSVSDRDESVVNDADEDLLPTAYQIQNQQTDKENFFRNQTFLANQATLLPSYALKAGTWINATLLTGINSDLPGSVIAKVNRSVYDTKTGNFLLIPQGTTLIGVYDSQISYGQSRVLLVWSRLIFPNGGSVDLQGMPGVDLQGMSGLHDKVNNHYKRIFSSALLFSVFSAAGQLSQPKNSSDTLTNQQIIYSAIGQQMTQTGAQLIEKNAHIQPTLEIRPGTRMNVLLTQDFIFHQAYESST
jgi:type IV secretory pathway VirB10-like protein